MRVIKVISCAVLCAFIILLSCLPAFAAETVEPERPKNYSQMTEAELLANNQIPIDYIIKTIQKQIDKTVKDDDGNEIRLYDFFQYLKQEDDTYKKTEIPVGKFSLVNFLQDKYFILSYSSRPVDSATPFSPVDKEKVYINAVWVFDNLPFVGVKQTDRETGHGDISKEPDFINKKFELVGKPGQIMSYDTFKSEDPESDISRSFLTRDGERLAFDSVTGQTGNYFNMLHCNAYYRRLSWDYTVRNSFYMNFMPEGGDGMLNPYVVTDKDISSEKQYIDDPDRPDGKYEYAVYEFQNDVMTMAQYFEAKPESVIPSKVGSMTNYTIKHFGNSYVWDVKNNKYTEFNAGWVMTTTTNLFKDYPSTNTVVKFSWKPFDDYDGELYQDNALLVDGNGFVTKRPTGSYPYVMKRYVNSKLYETFYFQFTPSVYISDLTQNYEKATMTAKITVNTAGSYYGQNSGIPWYSKRQDVFYVPSKGGFANNGQLKEEYNVNIRFFPDGTKEGNYVTFNWDAGGVTDSYNTWNPFYNHQGDKLDPFYEENKDNIIDDEGNLVGQGDGSKPGKNDGSGFDFGDFEFNSDSLWKYATEFLNFCKNTFAVLPSFIWQIIGTGAVIVVVLRILGR